MKRLALLALLAGCSTTPAPPLPSASHDLQEARGARKDVDVAGLAAAQEAGHVPVLVDVRTPGEFAEGHVPGAVNIPVDELGGRVAELEAYRGGEVYLICRSGARSSRAADQLVSAGFTAVNVEGGTLAWTGSGRPVE